MTQGENPAIPTDHVQQARPDDREAWSDRTKILLSVVSFFVSIVLVGLLAHFNPTKRTIALENMVQLTVALTLSAVLVIWGSSVLRAVAYFVRSSARSLGDHETKKDSGFVDFVGEIYSRSLADSIFDYEEFCKNEYFADWNRHAFSYILIFASSVISVGVAFWLLTQNPSADWVTAAAAVLPGLVSGICMKIWLETRKNMEASRKRIDYVFRTRVRMNLVLGRRNRDETWIEKEIELAEKLMGFIVPRPAPMPAPASDPVVEAGSELETPPT